MLLLNVHPDHDKPLAAADATTLGASAPMEVDPFLRLWPEHRQTPLHSLAALARELGIGALHVKDESHRLGLDSFKALGGSYAVARLVLEEAASRLGRKVEASELLTPEIRAIASTITLGCATAGNHGRSVAAGARLAGATARIFVHQGVHSRRTDAIAELGAEITQVSGTYDDAVAEATRVCAANGWLLVSDTSWPGYERIPALVMQGYTVLAREALQTMGEPPTHVFIQAGVGGLAAAMAGHMAMVFGDERPAFVVVEPRRAACIFESARAGHRVKVGRREPTVMSMLECYEPSHVAWRVLSHTADAFVTITDEEAAVAVSCLAPPATNVQRILATESGAAGLGGLLQVARDARERTVIALDANSRVLVVNTEAAPPTLLFPAPEGAP